MERHGTDNLKKKKVMVIDDEVDFLEVVKLNLEETNNYEVMGLSSAKDIISKINAFKPDIILLDLLMPTLGGIQTCEILNEDSLGKQIPIIIVSALDKDEDKLRAYKVGVVDYLTKPVSKDILIAKIEKALRFE